MSWFTLRANFEGAEVLDASACLTVDALKEIIDTFLAGPPEELPSRLPDAMRIVYRGMTLTGVAVAERHRWLDRVVRIGERNVSLATHSPQVHEQQLLDRKMRFCTHAARLLAEEGDAKAARSYVEELISLLSAAAPDSGSYAAEQARLCIEKMNAPDLKDKLEAAMAGRGLVCPLSIHWPQFNPWGQDSSAGRPRTHVQAMRYDDIGASPLAACGGRMYCIIPGEEPKDPPRAGFIDLDEQGRPAGKITLLPHQPSAGWPREILCTAVCKDRLYMGTSGAGLLEYDPGTGQWRTLGPEQGLPDWNVYSLLAMDDGTLFCHGGDKQKQGFFCRVDPTTSQVTLLRRIVHSNGRNPLVDTGLHPAWQAGDGVAGFVGGGSLYTLPKLAADEPMVASWPGETEPRDSYEMVSEGMAVVAGRRFILCRDALREIDEEGKVLKQWATYFRQRLSDNALIPADDILLPSDVPDLVSDRMYRVIAHDSSHLFLLSDWILCFDPASDTWYGPLETEPWTGGINTAVSGHNGIWFSTDRQLIYLDTAEFIAAATKAGRVITGPDFRARRQAHIKSAPALEQAKWAMCLRQWDKARDLCADILDKDAANAEALLMMGLLHESCCLNQPEKAMEYYVRLAAIDNNVPAALAGLIHQYRLHVEAKRYSDALRVGRLVQERYPRNTSSERLRQNTHWLAQKAGQRQGEGM